MTEYLHHNDKAKKMSFVSTELNEQKMSNNDKTKRETQTFCDKSPQNPESDGCENVPVKYAVSASQTNYVLPPVDESLIEDDDCFPLITSVYSLANLDKENNRCEAQFSENSISAQKSYSQLPEGNSFSEPPDLSKALTTKEHSTVEAESNSWLKMECKKEFIEYSDITNTLSAPLTQNGSDNSKDKQLAASKEKTEQFYPSAEKCLVAKPTGDNKTDNALFPKADVSTLIDLGQTKYGPMNPLLKSNGSQQVISGQVTPGKGKSNSLVENTIGDASPLSRLEKRMTELVSSSQPNNIAAQTSVNSNSTKISASASVSQQQKLIKTSTPRGTFYLNVPVDTHTVYIIHYPDGTRFFTVPQGTSLSQESINALAQGQQVVVQKAVLPPMGAQNTTSKSIPQPIAPKPDSTLITAKPSNSVQTNAAPLITVQSENTVGLPLEKSRANLSGDSVLSNTSVEQQKKLIRNTQVATSSCTQTVASHSGGILETSTLDKLNSKKELSGTLYSPQSGSAQHQNDETRHVFDKINVSTPSLVSSSEKSIEPRSLFPVDDSDSSVSTSLGSSSMESTVKTDSGRAESQLPSNCKNSVETGLSPHEAKIQRLKELMKEQEKALEKLREKRKREVDNVRESSLIKDSTSATNGQINLGTNDSVSRSSGNFLTPAPPKSSTPFARNFQRTRDLDEHPSSTPAKKLKKTEAIGNATRSPKVSTANTRTDENVAFVPNGEDQKFVRLVGLETVVTGLSNKENCDKLDR